MKGKSLILIVLIFIVGCREQNSYKPLGATKEQIDLFIASHHINSKAVFKYQEITVIFYKTKTEIGAYDDDGTGNFYSNRATPITVGNPGYFRVDLNDDKHYVLYIDNPDVLAKVKYFKVGWKRYAMESGENVFLSPRRQDIVLYDKDDKIVHWQ